MTTPTTHRAAIDVQVWRGETVESQHAVLAAVVVKAVDGANRVAEAALVPRFAAFEGKPEAVLAGHAQSIIENWRGIRTGYIRAVAPT